MVENSCSSLTVVWNGLLGECKVHADEPQVTGLGWIDGSGRGGIGIVHQVLVLARESHTPISEARSEVWVKHRRFNEVEMDREDYLIF